MIKVKTLTGKEIEIDIEPTDTIDRIKERVEEKEGIPPVQQRFVFKLHTLDLWFSVFVFSPLPHAILLPLPPNYETKRSVMLYVRCCLPGL